MTVDQTVLNVLPSALRENPEIPYEEKLMMAQDLDHRPTLAERMLYRQLESTGLAFARKLDRVERVLEHLENNKVAYMGAALTASAMITSYLRMR